MPRSGRCWSGAKAGWPSSGLGPSSETVVSDIFRDGEPIRKRISAITDSGSGRRPGPYSPQAMSPSSGCITVMPSVLSCSILRRVAACCHIRTFIAGTASTGASVANNNVVARSSATPPTIFASRFAVAGHMTIRSASRDNWMWPISASSLSDQRVV